MASIIAQSEFASARYLPVSSDRLMILFSSFNYKPPSGTFWGDVIAKKIGWSAIGITSLNARDWFPRDGMLPLIPAIKDIAARYKTVVAYGGSMGGYGALKYGRSLGANHTVAFAPQVTLDPRMEPERGYNQHYIPRLHEGMEIQRGDLSANSVIFFDPRHKTDTMRVNYVKSVEPRVALIPLPYAGHKCIQVAAGTDRLSSILDLTTSGQVSSLPALGRRLRISSPARYSNLAAIALPRRAALAEKIMASAPTQMPPKLIGEFKFELAEHYLRHGDHTRALEASSVAAIMQPDDPNFHRQVGRVCSVMRLWRPAIAAFERGIALSNEDIPTLITLAHIAHKMGDRVRSEAYLSKAEKINPDHPRYVTGKGQLYAAWGRK